MLVLRAQSGQKCATHATDPTLRIGLTITGYAGQHQYNLILG